MSDFNKYTVLIVDDDDALRNTIVFDFKRKGFNVLSADNVAPAFELVKQNKVDLVISDMQMPGATGIDLLAMIKALNSNLPLVIFATGLSDLTADECISKGAFAVVPKPFDRAFMMSTVERALKIVDDSRIKLS